MKQLLRTSLLLLLCSLCLILPATADSSIPAEKQAILAALDFLERADRAEYERCWDHSSKTFRDQVDKQTWVEEMGHLRPQYGTPLQRSLEYSKPLDPAADNGNQPSLFLIFRTRFEQKTVAEMITLNREPDLQWRVVGYSIQ